MVPDALRVSRILAGTDFSSASQAALRRAGQLAAQHGAELRVIHARPDWNLFSARASLGPEYYQQLSDSSGLLLRRATDWLAREFSIRVTGEIQQGRASEVIRRAVDLYQPHLLVLGVHGEHAQELSATSLGATTVKVINHANLPLLLVRAGDHSRYLRSLAAIGRPTEQAARIIRWARTLTLNGECEVLHAYEVPYLERLRLSGISAEDLAVCVAAASTYEAPSLEQLEKGSCDMHTRLVHGSPVATILNEITRYRSQFVAIGRFDDIHRTTGHTEMGSVGLRVASEAQVDVLVVP